MRVSSVGLKTWMGSVYGETCWIEVDLSPKFGLG